MILLKEEISEKQYLYTFIKSKASHGDILNINLLDLPFYIGDLVIISTENGQYGLGIGTIKTITQNEIVILAMEPLEVKI